MQPDAPGATERMHGCNPVATGLATDNSLNGNGKSLPVARLHGFSGGYEEKKSETADDDLSIPPYLRRAFEEESHERGEPPGQMAVNGFAISATPEDRRPLEPGQLTARVWIKEIRPPALGPPGDDLNDFVR